MTHRWGAIARRLSVPLLLAGCGAADPEETAVQPPEIERPAAIVQPASEVDAYTARLTANGVATLAIIDRRLAGADRYGQRLSPAELLDYELYKEVARELRRRDLLELNSHIGEGAREEDGTLTRLADGSVMRPPSFDVIQCDMLDILAQEKIDDRQSALQQQAAGLVQLEGDLAGAGYDVAVYAAALATLERRKLQILSDELAGAPYVDTFHNGEDQDSGAVERAFVAEAEPLRRKLNPGLLPIIVDGGCGDGETLIPFEIRPKDGVAHIIREFSFEVCDRRRLNPWDADRCRSWVPVRDGGSLPVSGSYRVQVAWPDGRTYRGDFHTQAFLTDVNDVRPIRLDAPAARATRKSL